MAALFSLLGATSPPTPAPSPTPSAPADPCGSILSIVNRPTFSTGVCTVRTGHFEVESGISNTVTSGPGGGNTVTYGASLLRFGTFDPHLDLEIGPPLANRSSLGGTEISGWGDLGFGAKYEIGYTAKALWGVNAQVTVPSGTSPFSARKPQYTGNFNWAYTLNSTYGINGSLGFNSFGGPNAAGVPQTYFAFTPSLEATAGLPGPSEFFIEGAYFSSAGAGVKGKTFIDAGYVRDLGAKLQLDLEYGMSPTFVQLQRQHYVGAGVSFMN